MNRKTKIRLLDETGGYSKEWMYLGHRVLLLNPLETYLVCYQTVKERGCSLDDLMAYIPSASTSHQSQHQEGRLTMEIETSSPIISFVSFVTV